MDGRAIVWMLAGVFLVGGGGVGALGAGSRALATDESTTTVDGERTIIGASGGDIIDTQTNTALSREWVEIREEGAEGRIVLRPLGPDIPPARGRRRLDLRAYGGASSRTPGAADAMETRDGSWQLREEAVLEIVAPGWTGTYTVIELQEDRLVIAPR